MAKAKKAKGDELGAMQDVNEALKIYSNSSSAFLLRAKIKLSIGSKKTACEDLKEALKDASEITFKKILLKFKKFNKREYFQM